MANKNRPILTKILERIPQTLCLESGINIEVGNKNDNRKFWNIFTSSEYCSLLPELLSIRSQTLHLVDCGAGIGLFSLLIEHLIRSKLLFWENITYTLIEPSYYNFSKLKRNVENNFSDDSYNLINGLVGLKSGEVDFYESKRKPFSSGLIKHSRYLKGNVSSVRKLPFVDIGEFLNSGPCLLKIDIEGSEFTFVDTYRDDLSQVHGIVVEWHEEFGDVIEAVSTLESKGFTRVKRQYDETNEALFVDLYLRI